MAQAESGPLRTLLRADPAAGDPLAAHRSDAHPGISGKRAAAKALPGDAHGLAELQERLYAEKARVLLLILQGMDTSGKSGAIKYVVGAVNPQGCRITAFKQPTPAERRHHYLWRIRRALPPVGYLGVFDRSHYEDVLIFRVHAAEESAWAGRYDEINIFEEEVTAGGTTIVKCLLHISYEAQRERLLARLDDPTKRWKFAEADIDERRRWAEYQEAYREAIRRCSTAAPWYVVPADRKWYRKWAVGRILLETLRELDPQYPEPHLDVAALKGRLAPPN